MAVPFEKDVGPAIFIRSCHLRNATILRAALYKFSISFFKSRPCVNLLPSHDGENEHDHFACLTTIPDPIQNSVSTVWRVLDSVLDSCTYVGDVAWFHDKCCRLVANINANEKWVPYSKLTCCERERKCFWMRMYFDRTWRVISTPNIPPRQASLRDWGWASVTPYGELLK